MGTNVIFDGGATLLRCQATTHRVDDKEHQLLRAIKRVHFQN